MEVSPAVRRALKCGRIYIRYAACFFADHIRVIQCYRCLSFGHIAKDCKGEHSCGHCAGAHELKDCKSRSQPPKCFNCERYHGTHNDLKHSAMDTAKCPILGRKIKDRIAYINYN
ncbi:putative 50 kda protein in type i retrotransposable element r1dm [Lasius niger]|uniref:Putative 50 kDa protein in type i retrotransposable element r1dm n=1 Tax=Lasius niger TaxID=67767 RepID=A0A0J7KGQ7_LASNI|nr:putative 50 kda protein in type i retrotransposable element r1dm [Lasius niger]